MDNFYDVDRKWASPLWKTSSRHWCEVSRTKAGLKYTHLKWNGLTKKQPIPVNWMPFWIIQFNLCLEYNISSTVYEYANQTLPKYYHLTQCYYKNKSNLHMQKDWYRTKEGCMTVCGLWEMEGNLENSEDGGGESGLCCELALSGLARLAQKRSTIISTLCLPSARPALCQFGWTGQNRPTKH